MYVYIRSDNVALLELPKLGRLMFLNDTQEKEE